MTAASQVSGGFFATSQCSSDQMAEVLYLPPSPISLLNTSNEQALKTLVASLPSTNIPDQSGNSGDIEYSLYQIRILPNIRAPSSTITLGSGSDLTWSASNAGLSLTTGWRVKYKKGWFKFSTSGTVDVTLSGITFGIAINIGQDGNGKPTINAAGCRSTIGGVSVKFHGGIVAFLLNLFKGVVERKIKEFIPGKLCEEVSKVVNVNAQRELQTLKVTTPLLKDLFILDYRLVLPPSFTSLYLQTYHKGEISWAANPSPPPFSPQPIPLSGESSKMLYMWISEYLPQSFAYTAQNHGFLRYNLTGKDVQPGNATFLDTTCPGFSICVGTLFPAIAEKYPNSQVELRMSSSRMPIVKMRPGSLGATFAGSINFFAHTPSGQVPYLLTLNVSASMNFSASISEEMVKGKILSTRTDVGVQESAIGPVNDQAQELNAVVEFAMNSFIVPKMNEVGSRGFPLPKVGKLKFLNSELEILTGALMVSTDVQYLAQK